MKRNKKLLILIGILIVCIVGYSVVSVISKKSEEDSVSESTDITVTNFSADDVALLCWNYQGEDYSLTLTDSYWYNSADADFPVKQSYASTMSTQIASITASRKLENVADFSEYGLDDPSMSVSVMTSTGGELSFIFGDINSVSGEYYMQYSEGSSFVQNGDVYLVSEAVVNAFSYTMDQLIQFESLPDLSDINSVKITANEIYRISYMGEDNAIPWILRGEEGSKRTANTTLCEELVSTLEYLSFTDCVNYDAKSADLAEYGLDEPWAVITVDYNISSSSTDSSEDTESDTLTLSLGNVDENGNYYVMIEDYTMLYTVESDLADWIKGNNIASITDISDML